MNRQMKQQTQKGIWYWMIIGVGIITLLTFAYSGKTTKKKKTAPKKQPKQEAVVENKEQPVTTDDQAAQGGGTEPIYYEQASGGVIGQNYLLTNSSIKDTDVTSQLIVYLAPTTVKNLPKHTANLSNNAITLKLTDTRDFDITTGGSSYLGQYNIAGKGVISNVKLVRLSGSAMQYTISLTKKAFFRVDQATNPLRLVVKIAK